MEKKIYARKIKCYQHKSKASNTLTAIIVVKNTNLVLLCARRCLKHFAYIISFQTYDNLMR